MLFSARRGLDTEFGSVPVVATTRAATLGGVDGRCGSALIAATVGGGDGVNADSNDGDNAMATAAEAASSGSLLVRSYGVFWKAFE